MQNLKINRILIQKNLFFISVNWECFILVFWKYFKNLKVNLNILKILLFSNLENLNITLIALFRVKVKLNRKKINLIILKVLL